MNFPKLLGAMLISIAYSASAFCQSPAATSYIGAGSYQVAGTYTHVLTDTTFGPSRTLNGWTASFSAPVIPLLRADIEAGHYRGASRDAMTSFLAGPRFTVQFYRFQPFIRGLLGISRATGVTPFTIAAGGGLDMILTQHVSLRLLQADYYRLYGGGTPNGADYLRMGVGVTYQFGSR